MPKLSFRIPQPQSVQTSQGHEHLPIAVLGLVAIAAIVVLVVFLSRTMTGAVSEDAIINICGPNALIADNPWYVDQLERLHYQCLSGREPRIYCCYKK